MNEHQLLCFLTVSRTLNFSAAARELYCTQPALSYQIRSLEKELDAALFRRTTTQVALTEAGRALLPHAEDLYRGILNARTALKGFGTHHTLTLRLPPVLLQRDPIYPILMARLHAALPGYEFKVDTTPVPSSYHHMLCTEADAALYLPSARCRQRSAVRPSSATGFTSSPRRSTHSPAKAASSFLPSPGSRYFTSPFIRTWWISPGSSRGCPIPHRSGGWWKTTSRSTPSCWPGEGCSSAR